MGDRDRAAPGGLPDAFRCAEPRRPSSRSKQVICAVQIPLGHTKIESTVRYLGVDIEDALALSEGAESNDPQNSST